MSDGRRRAALTLHSLGEEDRRWVLQQLPGGERAQLNALLAELGELGIPADPAIVQALPVDAAGRIRASNEKIMFAILHPEPDATVAACLAMEPWPWRDAFLRKLPAARRAVVAAAMGRSVTARMRETLIELLDGRLPTGAPKYRAGALAQRAIERARRLWHR